MKHWGRRLLSLGLVVLMLVTMIPMGTVTASALDYSQSEFTIGSVSDWNTIANATQDFAGKTVKLTANINAGGTTLATLFDTFAGTLDGQGFTVSNFKATDALIAKTTTAGAVIKNLGAEGRVDGSSDSGVAMLIGSHDGTGSLTVSNVSVGGVVASTGTHAGGVIGVLTLKDKNEATLEKITVNATVSNIKVSPTNQMSGTGGVIGIFEPIGKPTLTVKSLELSGSVTSTASVGGVVGAVFTTKAVGSLLPEDNDNSWNNRTNDDPDNPYKGQDKTYYLDLTSDELYTGGTIEIANCQSTMTLSTSIATEVVGVGGILGTFGGYKRYHGDNFAYDGDLKINNCVIGGEIKNTSGKSHPSSVGGVLGAMSYSHAKVSVEHCLITASFPTHSLTAAAGKGAGLVLGTSACQAMSSLSVNNCVTTVGEFAILGSIVARAGGGEDPTGAWLVFNDKNLTGIDMPYSLGYYAYATYAWKYSASVTDASVMVVSAEVATAMIKTDAQGYVYRVGGQVTALAVQDNVPDDVSLTSSDTYAIRFIGVVQESSVRSAKMTVVVRNADTGKAIKRYNTNCKIYDALNAYSVGGAKLAYYKASDFGAKKFLALTIGDIPAGTSYSFEFTPAYTNDGGIVVTGETVSVTYDRYGQYVKSNEGFDVAPLVTAPTVRIISSNIMTEDPVTYNLDDVSNLTGETYDRRYDVYDETKKQMVEDVAAAKADTTIYKNGKTYYWYFRDDLNGETLGRINKKAGTGWGPEQRLKAMAAMYMAYEPDFIGLQEVNGGPKQNNQYYFADKTSTMQSVLLKYMGSNYAYVDFTDYVAVESHHTPIMYRTDKWKVTDRYATTDTGCDMHRWQWARFESLQNSKYSVIVLNLHGHVSACNKYAEFYSAVNAEIKKLEKQYPESTILITGDYNLNSKNAYLTQTLIEGTNVRNSLNLTTNDDFCRSDIDHVFVSRNTASVEQLRVMSNGAWLSRATDHPSVFADVRLEPTPTPGAMMDWNDG